MRILLLLRWTLMGAALAAPLLWPDNTIAGLIVTGWEFRTGIIDSQGGQVSSAGTSQLQNPFTGQFTANLPPSHTSAAHQASWNATSVSLILDTALHAETLQGNVTTFGHLNVTPEVDSILSFHSVFQYSIPTQPARASSAFTILGTNPSVVIYNNSQVRTNFVGPPSGTLVANDDIFLAAGQSWRIQWSFGMIHFDPSIPGAASDSTGHLAFQIHPAVPEPATLSLLLLAAAAMRRPRRRLRGC